MQSTTWQTGEQNGRHKKGWARAGVAKHSLCKIALPEQKQRSSRYEGRVNCRYAQAVGEPTHTCPCTTAQLACSRPLPGAARAVRLARPPRDTGRSWPRCRTLLGLQFAEETSGKPQSDESFPPAHVSDCCLFALSRLDKQNKKEPHLLAINITTAGNAVRQQKRGAQNCRSGTIRAAGAAPRLH